MAATGCAGLSGLFAKSSQAERPPDRRSQAILPRLHPTLTADLNDTLGQHLSEVRKALAEQAGKPAQLKRDLARKVLADPLDGLTVVEHTGLQAMDAAASGVEGLAGVIDVLEGAVDQTGSTFQPLTFPAVPVSEALLEFVTTILERAHQDRERALRHLSPQDREWLFAQAERIALHFVPQLTLPAHAQEAEATARFAALVAQQIDYPLLISAAQRLARLGNHKFLKQLELAFQGRKPIPNPPAGVTGDVLLSHQTSYGLILIGGAGPNSYVLEKGAALIIDLGGNDTYRGMVGASPNTDLGNSVVVDLGGNDTYQTTTLGLATGRLGIGLVIDHGGDDTYQLAPGSGGTGLAGIGVLFDGGGHDVYEGSRFTQGAGLAGLGLLIDLSGNDRYRSHGYAMGFGGPLGAGALLDMTGNDSYVCGDKYPSAYNAADAPDAKPTDPAFQYDCFGMGAGVGLRILGKAGSPAPNNLAGGLGMLLDVDGDDRYHSANFAQGHGYFFGIGAALDLNGDDDHQGARYGHGSSAHAGIGLMVDYQGKDRYGSKGPFYNGGTAWDRSVALGIDGGQSSDLYDLPASTGLGMGDHGGWGLFVEEGGADQYAIKRGLGIGSDGSIGAFIDLEGRDDYSSVPPPAPGTHPERLNRKTYLESPGSLFIDR
ncbi:MAG: hypothetical protein U0361_04990 [Nitrospiraceae bacterium]